MMKTQEFLIDQILAVVWGELSDRVFPAVHGSLLDKEDTIIRLLAEGAALRGVQVIGFDLPEYGERAGTQPLCKVQLCVRDLRKVMDYAKSRWQQISLFVCNMGVYFSPLEYHVEPLRQALFLPPIADMRRIIENMTTWFEVTGEWLQKPGRTQTLIGQTLYQDYYCYVREHPVEHWSSETVISYGENDTLCERDTIDAFTRRFLCKSEVIDGGEHFSRTPEQLAASSARLKQNLHRPSVLRLVIVAIYISAET